MLDVISSIRELRSPARRLLNVALVLVVTAGLSRVFLYPASVRVSGETTYITSPLRPDGRPDYVAYLNSNSPPNLTPENNAAVPLLTFIGENPLRGALASHRQFARQPVEEPALDAVLFHFWNKLGMDGPPAGPAFRSYLNCSVGNRPGTEINHRELWSKADQLGCLGLTLEERELLAEWIDSQAASLELLAEASERRHCFVPAVKISADGGMASLLIAGLPALRDGSRALQLRSELRLLQGDLNGAIADALVLPRLVDQLARVESVVGPTLALLVAVPAADALQSLLLSSSLSQPLKEQVRELARPRIALPELIGAWNEACRIQYLDYALALQAQGEWGDPKHPQQFPRTVNINGYLTQLNRYLDRQEEVMWVSDAASLPSRLSALECEFALGESRVDAWNRQAEQRWGYYLKRPTHVRQLQRSSLQLARKFSAKLDGYIRLQELCESLPDIAAVPAPAAW